MTDETPTSLNQEISEPVNRPDMLKILCIFSFIMAGLELIIFSLGTTALGMSAEQATTAFESVVASQPAFADVDAVEFFHAAGMFCLYFVLATVVSLLGIIMMWKMERVGLLIYTVAELATHLIPFDVNLPQQSGNGGIVFSVLLDLLFVALYFTQLKYFKKRS